MIKKQPQFKQRTSLLVLCVFCFSLLTINSYAQFSKKQEVTFKIGMAGYTFKDISVDNTIEMMNNITYFGADFTYVNIKLGIAKRSEYSKSFFEDFNDFIILYCNKFFKISNKEFTKNRNFNIDLDHIYNNYNTKNINITTIQKVISSLKTIEKTNSIGIIIFITEMDKIKETEIFTICYFDIANKKIIGFYNIVSEAKGVGMANHWTRPVIDFLQDPISVKFNFYN